MRALIGHSCNAGLGLSPSDFAVLTSNKELNALGLPGSATCSILLTTHSMIEKGCQGRAAQAPLLSHVREANALATKRRSDALMDALNCGLERLTWMQ